MAQDKPAHLVVDLGDVDTTKIVGVVAYEEGIYKKNGLDVKTINHAVRGEDH